MAWYDDLWSGIKTGIGAVKDVVSTVAPVLPYILKKGGSPKDFKDTPANRKKIISAFKKMHPQHKMKVDALFKVMKPKKAKKPIKK